MEIIVDNFSIAPIQPKDAWRLCNFVVANENRLKLYFPKTLQQNQTPTLAQLFVQQKHKQFVDQTEFLFVVKENTNRAIVALIYVKELQKRPGQGELAYCIGYAFEGKGLRTKFVEKIVEWSFKEAGLNRLQIIAHQANRPSIRVAEKLGFSFIEVLPKAYDKPGVGLVDMCLYQLAQAM